MKKFRITVAGEYREREGLLRDILSEAAIIATTNCAHITTVESWWPNSHEGHWRECARINPSQVY